MSYKLYLNGDTVKQAIFDWHLTIMFVYSGQYLTKSTERVIQISIYEPFVNIITNSADSEFGIKNVR